MKVNKMTVCAAVLGLTLILSGTAHAASDYTFDGTEITGYYQATNYEDVYGAQFNYGYGAKNVPDYQYPELLYGVYSNTSIGVMDRIGTSRQTLSFGGMGIDAGGIPTAVSEIDRTGRDTAAQESYIEESPASAITVHQKTGFTSTSGMEFSNGSIGTLKIPSLGINMSVWDGETNDSMAKGVAHYTSTSGWDGNIGLCGHNRGTKYAIGSIKDLQTGDTISYTTVYGTRTYAVTYVDTISNDDWSRLQATADNRITITTCLANQPSRRVVVQAIEK